LTKYAEISKGKKKSAQSLPAASLDESDQSEENENPPLLVEERKNLYDHDLIGLRRKPAMTDFGRGGYFAWSSCIFCLVGRDYLKMLGIG
jgi:hypothetical protein